MEPEIEIQYTKVGAQLGFGLALSYVQLCLISLNLYEYLWKEMALVKIIKKNELAKIIRLV